MVGSLKKLKTKAKIKTQNKTNNNGFNNEERIQKFRQTINRSEFNRHKN